MNVHVHVHVHGNDRGHVQEVPVSRQVVRSLSVLYHHHGIGIFYKGLPVAGLYLLARTSIAAVLGATVLRPTAYFQQPVAEVLSTVVVSELHLSWTQSSVSSSSARPTRREAWSFRHHRHRWKALVIPSAAHGSASALLRSISKLLPETATATAKSIEMEIASASASGSMVAFAVMRAFLALITRVLVLAPLSVSLIRIEASFLDPSAETLVYSCRKRGFLSVKKIFRKREVPLSFSFQRARKQFLLSTCLWLLELHVKKCLMQMTVESLTFVMVSLMI